MAKPPIEIDPEVLLRMVDWRRVATELLHVLSSGVELPEDLAELAPQGDNDFQDRCYALALRQLGEDLK